MKIYKLINQVDTYWVIANDPTDALERLNKVLNAGEGYGFSSKRTVTEIHLVADEITKSNSELWPYDLTGKHLLINV